MAGGIAVKDHPVRIKRFYEAVSVKAEGETFTVLLDGRQAKTQMQKPLTATTLRLAQAVAAEWDAQGDFIERATMPLSGMLMASIDGGEDGAEQRRQEVLDYFGSDLVCYRAEKPEALVQRQCAAWDPYIEWLRVEFGAALETTSGVVAIAQPAAAITAIRRALDGHTAETLFALRAATAITGSAALSLALWKNYCGAEEIFEASRVDERFQEDRWGVDEEAKAREDRLCDEFLTAGRFLSLL
jgi:chaperone required for assembly of F1-ATPase